MNESLTIPQEARNMIDLYRNLPINGHSIQTPYFMNLRKQRAGLRVMVGKGTPEEIIQEAHIYAKLKGITLDSLNKDEIRKFMIKVGIGIDCSGFLVHIFNTWLVSKSKKPIWRYLSFPDESFYRKVVRLLRPVENISVSLLANDENTLEVSNITDSKPGDMIRCRGLDGGFHIALITKVFLENNKLTSFEFVHSTRNYDDQNGVRFGTVSITDLQGGIDAQTFNDAYKGHSWIHDEILKDTDYASIRRFRRVPL